MRTMRYVGNAILVAVFFSSGLALPRAVRARESKQRWRIPVVMEQATLRGKIVVIEDRERERRVLEGMKVQVWTIAEPTEEETKSGKNTEPKRGKLLHDTNTDDLGFFSLPALEEGNYLMTIAELRLRLQVTPMSAARQGQQEPAVLLIMVPKEVITQKQS
jgi:hypothetical protein